MNRRIGPSMRVALAYITAHPGVSILQVDRACRTARGGHRWMYATVHRLEKAGLIRCYWNKGRYQLFPVTL